MLCSDTIIQVGETRTVEDCTIKVNDIIFDHVSMTITAPWDATYEQGINLGNTITIERTANEYIEITFLANMSGTAAKLNVCYAKEIELGSLFCESVPSGAEVYYKKEYIEAYEYMGTTTVWIEDVPPGERYIKMTLDGYETHEDSYEVEPGVITRVNVNLVPLVTTGTLSCNTTPSGANIYLNDVYQGLTNKTISNLEPGSYTVKYTKEGYEDYSVITTINAGVISYVTTILQTEPEPTGTLVCHSSPSEAEIWINDANTGEYTSKTFTDMPLGRYKIELKKAGYYSCADLYDIYEGQITAVSCTLVEKITTGQINCSSSPEGAEIYLNDVYSGLTNLNIKDLAPGSYVVRFELDGYETYETTKIVEAGLTEYVSKVLVEITKPQCIDYTTQAECEANDCYWWTSNNTCQSAPDGTTEYFDIYVKPYSWYEGKYEEAVSEALTLVTDLTGAMANYISSVTGYEYTGLEIKEDVNKNVIIVRIFLKDTSETSLVAPVIIAGAVGIIAGILIYTIGYVTGTSDGGYTKEEVVEIIDDASDTAVEACKERYPNRLTDEIEAKAYADCVGGVDTTKVIADADVVDEDPTEAIDIIDIEIDAIKDGIDDGSIEPEDIDNVVDENIRAPIDDIVDDYKEKAVDDNCVYDIAGECIVTTGALQAAILVGAGILGLIVYSAMKK